MIDRVLVLVCMPNFIAFNNGAWLLLICRSKSLNGRHFDKLHELLDTAYIFTVSTVDIVNALNHLASTILLSWKSN